MSRSGFPLRAGQRMTTPNGTEVVLPKDWVDLTRADRRALGFEPNKPSSASVSGFIPMADLPPELRRRFRWPDAGSADSNPEPAS